MNENIKAVLAANRWEQKKIVVAVSGGLDSMVLATLLREAGVDILIAHCNFGLRDEASDGDEQMVSTWAKQHGVPVTIKSFNTKKILAEQGGNLQETARDLRYAWFENLRQEHGFDLIATAHHQQDSVETMLINFMKGCGISGMHGILPRQQNIIRPLLSFTKAELLEYATANNVPWREDSSNASDKYLRNAIRHQLLPVMESLVPGVSGHLAGNTKRFAEAEMLYRESIARYRRKLIEKRREDWYIPVLKLRHVQPLATILWELIRPFGFGVAQLPDILHLLEAESGRYVSSSEARIIRNRNFLIITSLQAKESTHVLIRQEDGKIETSLFSITIKRSNPEAMPMEEIMQLPKTAICVDCAQLEFPLILRPWKTGDYFYPLGMNKKKKKVSRFLIEQKVPLHEKEKVWVLESAKKIVWVIGMRPDERFKVVQNTMNYAIFSVSNW